MEEPSPVPPGLWQHFVGPLQWSWGRVEMESFEEYSERFLQESFRTQGPELLGEIEDLQSQQYPEKSGTVQDSLHLKNYKWLCPPWNQVVSKGYREVWESFGDLEGKWTH